MRQQVVQRQFTESVPEAAHANTLYDILIICFLCIAYAKMDTLFGLRHSWGLQLQNMKKVTHTVSVVI